MDDLRFTVSRRSLLALAAHCRQAADPKAAMPVLANVKLTLRGSTLEGVATDLYRQASMKIDVQVDFPSMNPIGICVPAVDFLERVNAMPDGQIRIVSSSDGTKLALASTVVTRKYSIHAIPTGEFPLGFGPATDDNPLQMPASDLAQLIRAVVEAASTDTTRPQVNAVLLAANRGVVKAVATDGHRLHYRAMALPGDRPERDLLIALEVAKNIVRVLDDAAGEAKEENKGQGKEKNEKDKAVAIVKIAQSGPHIHFTIGNRSFGCKNVVSMFPPYRQVVPARMENELTLSKSVFLAAVKAINVVADERTGGIKLCVTENKIEVMSSSNEAGDGSEVIAVDYHGPAITVGLNANYVVDALTPIKEDEIKFGFSGDLDPSKFSAITNDGLDDTPSHFAIVMPMRV